MASLLSPSGRVDSSSMRRRPITGDLRRGLLVTFLATQAAALSLCTLLMVWATVRPSDPRLGPFGSGLAGSLILGLVMSVPLALWLLPLCMTVAWVFARRRVQGVVPALVSGCAAAGVCAAGLILPWVALDRLQDYSVWLEVGGTVCAACTFLLVWPVANHWLSPRRGSGGEDASAAIRQATSVRQAVGTALETLALIVASAFTLSIGLVLSMVSLLGAGVVYHLESEAKSPHGDFSATVVTAYTGGSVGRTYHQVFVRPAAETWSEHRPGLLLWEARHSDSLHVAWDSEHALRVFVRMSPGHELAQWVDEYERGGFTVKSEPLKDHDAP